MGREPLEDFTVFSAESDSAQSFGNHVHGTFRALRAGRGGARASRESADVPAPKRRALDLLDAEGAPLFAILDAARDGRVLDLLRESVEEFQSLYDGHAAELLEEVAPYLVHLPRGSNLLTRLVEEGWGESLGVYLTSAQAFKDVRAHLQRLLATSAQGKARRIYFRYYDPRVLRAFLPTCEVRRAAELFASTVETFLVEGPQGEVLRFSPPVPRDP